MDSNWSIQAAIRALNFAGRRYAILGTRALSLEHMADTLAPLGAEVQRVLGLLVNERRPGAGVGHWTAVSAGSRDWPISATFCDSIDDARYDCSAADLQALLSDRFRAAGFNAYPVYERDVSRLQLEEASDVLRNARAQWARDWRKTGDARPRRPDAVLRLYLEAFSMPQELAADLCPASADERDALWARDVVAHAELLRAQGSAGADSPHDVLAAYAAAEGLDGELLAQTVFA